MALHIIIPNIIFSSQTTVFLHQSALLFLFELLEPISFKSLFKRGQIEAKNVLKVLELAKCSFLLNGVAHFYPK